MSRYILYHLRPSRNIKLNFKHLTGQVFTNANLITVNRYDDVLYFILSVLFISKFSFPLFVPLFSSAHPHPSPRGYEAEGVRIPSLARLMTNCKLPYYSIPRIKRSLNQESSTTAPLLCLFGVFFTHFFRREVFLQRNRRM